MAEKKRDELKQNIELELSEMFKGTFKVNDMNPNNPDNEIVEIITRCSCMENAKISKFLHSLESADVTVIIPGNGRMTYWLE